MLCFIDSNIAIYWLQKPDPSDAEFTRKKKAALELVHQLGAGQRIVISTQVMGETFHTLTRKGKYPLSRMEAIAAVDLLAEFNIIPTDASLVQSAARRSHLSQLSYYDSLIVEAAIRAGAATLYTEDMQHGMRFGTLEICNPFVG